MIYILHICYMLTSFPQIFLLLFDMCLMTLFCVHPACHHDPVDQNTCSDGRHHKPKHHIWLALASIQE